MEAMRLNQLRPSVRGILADEVDARRWPEYRLTVTKVEIDTELS